MGFLNNNSSLDIIHISLEFTYVEYTVQWLLVYSQSYATVTINGLLKYHPHQKPSKLSRDTNNI